MTRLRQIMLEELRRRNYAESTIHTYIHTVEHFSRHFHRSPDQLGPEHIRQYQAALFTRWKLAPNTVTQRLAALRFFYVQVLKRGWSVAETPYPKKVLYLPAILSQEEVARLIDAAEFPFHRILLMTLYATGARRAEVAHLTYKVYQGSSQTGQWLILRSKETGASVYLLPSTHDWAFPGQFEAKLTRAGNLYYLSEVVTELGIYTLPAPHALTQTAKKKAHDKMAASGSDHFPKRNQ